MRRVAFGSICKFVILVIFAQLTATKQVVAEGDSQCISIEFFYDSETNDAADLRSSLEQFAETREGLLPNFRDLNKNENVQQRLEQIAKHFGLTEIKLPAMYGMNHIIANVETEQQLESRLKEVLQLTAYIRNGCPHCAAAKSFLGKYAQRYPAIKIVYKEVITDPAANQEMQAIVQRYRQRAASLPVIHYCNSINIGFDREATTGKKILQTLDYWSRSCAEKKSK